MMSGQNLEHIIPIMKIMENVERTIARFYTTCAESFWTNREFWMQLAKEEIWHADAVTELMHAVSNNPQMFVIGDSSPSEALESFVARIEANIAQLQTGRLTEDKAILVAYLIENTFVEGKYAEIIRPNGSSRLTTLEKLSSDSVEHRGRVLRKMREGRTK